MIIKHKDYKHGYCLLSTSTDRELQDILKRNEDNNVRVLFCNKNTLKSFTPFCKVTINNKLNDGCFFINYLY